MKRLRESIPMWVLAVLALAMLVGPALGQDGGERGDRGDRRGRPDWQNMSEEQREQMRERFEERMKQMRDEQAQRMREDLDMSEEEFGVLRPMIEKVQQLTMESFTVGRNPFGRSARGGRRGGPGGFGGFGNPFGDDANMSPQGKTLSEASNALSETLEQEEPSGDQVKQQLAALREARIAMQDALRQAREELRGYLTPQQEAELVLQGLLD